MISLAGSWPDPGSGRITMKIARVAQLTKFLLPMNRVIRIIRYSGFHCPHGTDRAFPMSKETPG
jgi:hypothetical protein